MENKQQTPLQRLIAELNTFAETHNVSDSYKTGIYTAVLQAIKLLPYEREVIENVVTEVMEDMTLYENFRSIKNASEYYNQTFQTNE